MGHLNIQFFISVFFKVDKKATQVSSESGSVSLSSVSNSS